MSDGVDRRVALTASALVDVQRGTIAVPLASKGSASELDEPTESKALTAPLGELSRR